MIRGEKMIRVSLKLALVAIMAIYPNMGQLSTASAAADTGAIQSVFAKTGTLDGFVTGSSGKPLANTTLTVVDSNGKKVASAVTDKAGKFSLPNLKPGQYRLMIGKDVQLKLNVADKGTTTNLKVVMPKSGGKLAPGMVKGAAGASNWTYIALAGLTAAILVPTGFAVAAANGNSDDGHD